MAARSADLAPGWKHQVPNLIQIVTEPPQSTKIKTKNQRGYVPEGNTLLSTPTGSNIAPKLAQDGRKIGHHGPEIDATNAKINTDRDEPRENCLSHQQNLNVLT
jgi:hypothetical protein